MTYDELKEQIRTDIMDYCNSVDHDDPRPDPEYLRFLAEKVVPKANGAKTLPELITVWGMCGWCEQDLIPYLLGLLIEDPDNIEDMATFTPSRYLEN